MKPLFKDTFRAVCLLGALAVAAFAQTADSVVINGELGARLDQYLARLAGYGFSGTVLVAKGNDLVLHKGYGLADMARGVPNTTGTVYDIASLAKQFTAAAILKLEMQGKLKTSDALSRHFSGVPEDKRAITLHHLLTHTAGLPFDCPAAESLNREQFVKCLLDVKLIAAPGQQYFYSNGGYGLLAAVIEQVSGQSYETFLTEQLFQPARLSATGFVGNAGQWAEAVVARGYDEGIERGVPQRKPLTWRLRGAAGLVTSVGDLYRWELALREQKILSGAATKKLFTAHVPTDAQGGQYGYGWALRKTERGNRLISHDGITTDGFNTSYQRHVDDGYVVIAASNSFAGRYLPLDLVAPVINSFLFGSGVASPPAFIALDAKTLEKYRGVYRLPSGARLSVNPAPDKLVVGAEGQEALDLLAALDAAGGKTLAAFNERTAALLDGARKGNYEVAIKAFAHQMSADDARRTIKNWLGGLEQKNGPLKSFELLGTAPEPGLARSFVRLNFERGVEVRRLRWEGDRLGNIVFAQLPILPTIFRPQSTTDFAGFHLGIAKPLRLSFEVNVEGVVTGLTFHSQTGSKVKGEKLLDVPAINGSSR
jgi:CubicO group peptidase (beta-lactamase class C family)